MNVYIFFFHSQFGFSVSNKRPWGRSSAFLSFSPRPDAINFTSCRSNRKGTEKVDCESDIIIFNAFIFWHFFPDWRRSKIHVGISRVRTETFHSHSLQLEGRYLNWNFLMHISSYLFVSQTVQHNLSWCSVVATSQRAPPTPSWPVLAGH